jgi:hypothetical protein
MTKYFKDLNSDLKQKIKGKKNFKWSVNNDFVAELSERRYLYYIYHRSYNIYLTYFSKRIRRTSLFK